MELFELKAVRKSGDGEVTEGEVPNLDGEHAGKHTRAQKCLILES